MGYLGNPAVSWIRQPEVGYFRSTGSTAQTSSRGQRFRCGRLVFHVFAALAEFIRELIVDGIRAGLAAARARGQRLGRPPAMTAEQIRQARTLLTRADESVSSIARLLGSHVPRCTSMCPSSPTAAGGVGSIASGMNPRPARTNVGIGPGPRL
ncbi:recombinase family protein [Nocardia brevicatena]|uniref:recombinase family protein n=1 Tax=Nocardia brevicatena TaxID=37327 RepID=UPI001C3F154A|nr:recombinase family protein [Nocardia brevicatena]